MPDELPDGLRIAGGEHSPEARIAVDLDLARELGRYCRQTGEGLQSSAGFLWSVLREAQAELAVSAPAGPFTAARVEALLAFSTLQTWGSQSDPTALGDAVLGAVDAYEERERHLAATTRVGGELLDGWLFGPTLVTAAATATGRLVREVAADPGVHREVGALFTASTAWVSAAGIDGATPLVPTGTATAPATPPSWAGVWGAVQRKAAETVNSTTLLEPEVVSHLVGGLSALALPAATVATLVRGPVAPAQAGRGPRTQAQVQAEKQAPVTKPGPATNASPSLQSLAAAVAARNWVDTPARVVGPAQPLGSRPAPTRVAQLVDALEGRGGPTDSGPPAGRVDVLRREWTDPRTGQSVSRAVVLLPGTSSWDVATMGRGTDVRDPLGNLRGRGGLPTAESRALASALKAAGVPPGTPVALVAHSQGGLTALAAANEPTMRRYPVTHVVTAGTPSADLRPPPGVKVCALENRVDPVPSLDGAATRPSRDVMTVSFPGREHAEGKRAHEVPEYVTGADALDRLAESASLDSDGARSAADFVADLRAHGYLADPGSALAGGDRVTLTRVELVREQAPAASGG
ncbi:hypothetical protein [Agilicoccus flavus]|uniref:hypothetical protein n=1 Tax=Agilicoccus flavus TaxID=2775968 RepID=UPI001CF63D33|nr:hypothetical protein [Agilicoccus flavus]